jgi:hypothetical protein
MLALVPFIIKNWRYFALGAAALAAVAWFEVKQHEAYTSGQQAAVQKVEQANDQARLRAASGAKSVDDCFARDGDWDRDRGVCNASAAR